MHASTIVTGIALAASLGALAHGTALSDAAAALQPGQWAELATNQFNAATLADGIHDVFYYTEDLAWDPVTRQLLFVGGGHANDAEFVRYSEATNTWTRTKPAGGFWHGNFSHAYDHLAVVPSLGRFYFRQPASSESERIEIYDIAAGTWSRSPLMPQRPECCGALEYFPDLGGLVMLAGPGPIHLFDSARGSWSTLSSGAAIGDYHNFAEYSPRHRVMIFGGGEGANGRALFRMNAARQITRLNDAPQRMGTTYSVVSTDPVGGNFLVFFDNAAYELDPLTQAWRPMPAPPWLAHGEPGIFNVVATPIATYGVTLFAKYAGDDSRVWLYRHVAAPAAPPAVSLDANPGSVASGNFSVLSWTTSDATQCAGANGTPAWPGNKSVPNGSESVGPLSVATTFSLACSGPGGAAERAVTVSVQAPGGGGGGGGSNTSSDGGGGLLGLPVLLALLCTVAVRAS